MQQTFQIYISYFKLFQNLFSVLILGEIFWLIGLSNAIMVVFFLSGINLSIFLTFNPPIYRIGNAPNILCPRCKEQGESHPHFTFNCKISKNNLYWSELHKVSLNFVSWFNKLQDAATELSSEGFYEDMEPSSMV